MNWAWLRTFPWLDTRARFVASLPKGAALLDLGASDGETLGHFAQLRPDLRFFAADKTGQPQKYPTGCKFHRADFERETLPWLDGSIDAITCMHLIEHLHDLSLLLQEAARLLKPGARIYFETPHPKSLSLSSPRGLQQARLRSISTMIPRMCDLSRLARWHKWFHAPALRS